MNWFQAHIFSNQTWLLPLLFFWVSISSYGQEEEVDLSGNWQIQKHPEYETVYQELYFDGTSLFVYNEHVQLQARREYRVSKNEILITYGLGEGELLGRVAILTPSKLVIEKEGIKLEFRSLSGAKNSLENLILKRITGDDFSLSFFERHEEWLSN
ncbi:MAG: hypothetical protein AAFU57_05940 [Bacteroidota bacterium]